MTEKGHNRFNYRFYNTGIINQRESCQFLTKYSNNKKKSKGYESLTWTNVQQSYKSYQIWTDKTNNWLDWLNKQLIRLINARLRKDEICYKGISNIGSYSILNISHKFLTLQNLKIGKLDWEINRKTKNVISNIIKHIYD